MTKTYILAVAVLGVLGLASLGVAGKPSTSSCSCVVTYNDAYQQCKTIRSKSLRDACIAQAGQFFRDCMTATTDPACQ